MDCGAAVRLVVISVLVVAVALVLLLLAARWTKKGNENDSAPQCLSQPPFLQTGDLLAVSYADLGYRPLVKLFTGSVWNHVAFVHRNDNDNQVCLLEACDYSRNRGSGVLQFALPDWLRIVRGYPLLWRPLHCSDSRPDSAAVEREFLRVRGRPINRNLLHWLETVRNRDYVVAEDDEPRATFFCSEFVAYLLQRLGILQRHQRPAAYSPRRLMFATADDLALKPTYRYETVPWRLQ